VNFNAGGFGFNGGFSQSDLYVNGSKFVSKDTYAWYAQVSKDWDKFGAKVGYRYISPRFGAPGDWGRIGLWWNPTDIKGVYGNAYLDVTP
ncbi:hypothetical protein, partial [Staphylococcus aureus]